MPTTTNELTVPQDAQQMARFQSAVKEFERQLAEFRAMPLSLVKANIAQEAIQVVKTFLKGPESYFRPDIKKADELHKSLLAKLQDITRIPVQLDLYCRSVIRDWTAKEEIRKQNERMAKEREARLEAERLRQEELAHMQAQNVPTEIIEQRAADPIVVAPAQVDEDKGRVEGAITVERWVGEVTDMGRFLKYIADIPGLWSLVEVKQGLLDRHLTSSKGQAMEGVSIKKDFIVRSKANG